MLRILLTGKGEREHALAWRLSRSSRVEHVYVVPSNGGTARGLADVSNELLLRSMTIRPRENWPVICGLAWLSQGLIRLLLMGLKASAVELVFLAPLQQVPLR